MFWFFGHKTCGMLAPQPGIKLTPLALEGEILPTGLPGESQINALLINWVIGGIPSSSLVIFPQGLAVSYLKVYALKPHVNPGPTSAIYPSSVFPENLPESGSYL